MKNWKKYLVNEDVTAFTKRQKMLENRTSLLMKLVCKLTEDETDKEKLLQCVLSEDIIEDYQLEDIKKDEQPSSSNQRPKRS